MRLSQLLLALCLLAVFAEAAPSQQRRSARELLQGLRDAVSSLWRGPTRQTLQCTECVQLAVGIANALYKPPDVDSEDPNIAVAGPGRRMRVQFKEPDIFAALDAACAQLGASQQLSEAVVQDCERRIREHRSSLEDHIFDKGTDGLAAAMCVDQLGLCDMHSVMDSGEL